MRWSMSKDREDKTGERKPGDQAAPGTPGTGEALCPKCSGSGRIDGRPCETCRGTGKIIQGVGGG